MKETHLASLRQTSDLRVSRHNDVLPTPDGRKYVSNKQRREANFIREGEHSTSPIKKQKKEEKHKTFCYSEQ